jgi:hypothetical protein
VHEQNLERLSVTGESLKAIGRGDDEWIKTQGLTVKNGWLPEVKGGISHVSLQNFRKKVMDTRPRLNSIKMVMAIANLQ